MLHDWFGDVEYWSIRRSMRFAPDLVKIANEFRLNQLISDDEMDSTKMAKKWENHRVSTVWKFPDLLSLRFYVKSKTLKSAF